MKILLVSAHPDDAEVACAGTIFKLKDMFEECRIWSIYFCPCTEDPINDGNLDDWNRAMDVLGVERKIEESFPRNILEESKQDVRDILHKIKLEFKPDLVFCPSLHDLHQDHRTVAECCFTIFRDISTILGYEIPRSAGVFAPNVYVTLDAKYVLGKIKVLEEWKSQFKARPNFFVIDKFIATLRHRGIYVNTEYAEAFELIWGRW